MIINSLSSFESNVRCFFNKASDLLPNLKIQPFFENCTSLTKKINISAISPVQILSAIIAKLPTHLWVGGLNIMGVALLAKGVYDWQNSEDNKTKAKVEVIAGILGLGCGAYYLAFSRPTSIFPEEIALESQDTSFKLKLILIPPLLLLMPFLWVPRPTPLGQPAILGIERALGLYGDS